MKTKTHAWQLAVCSVMVLALGSAPGFAADREADAATARAEVKAGNPVPKAKIENPAVKSENVQGKIEAKKEQAVVPTESKVEKAAADIKTPNAASENKVEEATTTKPEAFSHPAPVPTASPAPQAQPQGLLQKFRSLFGPKKPQAPSSVVTPVAPAPALTNLPPKSEGLPLGSPPNVVTAPAGTEVQKGPEPKSFVPPALPIQPSLVAPLAPPPPAAPAVKAPDPPNLKQAEKVAKLFNLKQRLQGPVGPITMLMMMEVDRANPGQIATTQKAISEAQAQFAADHEQEMQEDTARFYAENFTADELQQLKEFYESSAGQKLMKNGDELQRRQSMFGNELAMKNVSSLREEILKTIKKYDLKPPKAPEAHK